MKLIRSWPDPLPAGRNYVIDDAPRMLNSNYSYAGLVGVGDDLIQLDWDTAVSREDLTVFAALAREHPDRVLVAPVPVYGDSRRGLNRTVWNLRRYTSGETHLRYVDTGEPTCHLFGFGMVYLPRELVAGFVQHHADDLAAGRVRFDDSSFAGWHHRHVQTETRIAWQVRPIHLHYKIGEVPL
jgi:hypothetical protein